MLGVLLADAYASRGLRQPLKLTLGPGQGAGLALASQGLAWLVSPDFAVPPSVLFYGCAAGLLVSSVVRMSFRPPTPGGGRQHKEGFMRPKAKMALFYATLLCIAAVFWMVAEKGSPEPKLTDSQFLVSVESGRVATVRVLGSNSGAVNAICRLADGGTVRTVLPADYSDALRAMQAKSVNIEIRDSSSDPLRLLINTTPLSVLLAAWFFMMRKLGNGPRQGLWG
jgi:hypothetical protein